jgi:hypothetical protein
MTVSNPAFFGRAVLLVLVAVLAGCGARSDMSAAKLQKLTALQQQIAQLDAQADRIKDANDVKRLQRAYGYYVDKALWDEVADLFAADGSIEIGRNGVYSGQDHVRKFLYALGGGKSGLKQGQLNEHMQLQPVVDVAADGLTAKARWRTLIIAGEFGKSAYWGEGPYENEYVKQDGVWKIRKLHWYQTFLVPYKGGWAHNKDATGGVFVSQKELPSDAPPSESYEVWPGVYTPPFHYKNPVNKNQVTGNRATADESQSDENQANENKDIDQAIAALESTVGTLQNRIQLLQDTDAIENLVSIYGYYLDKQQWDLLTDIFADDATMEISERGVYAGKPSIRKALELFGPQGIQPEHVHNHMQLQPVIHVAPDGKTARVRSRAFSQLGTFNGKGIWMGGVYENEYVKQDGVWKIKKDHVYTTYFADYDQGWSTGARGTAKPSDKIPPDRPATEHYDAFPGVYIPAFDYKHPVTGKNIQVPSPTAAREAQ